MITKGMPVMYTKRFNELKKTTRYSQVVIAQQCATDYFDGKLLTDA